jgi:hypothetical protein
VYIQYVYLYVGVLYFHSEFKYEFEYELLFKLFEIHIQKDLMEILSLYCKQARLSCGEYDSSRVSPFHFIL